MLDFERTRFRLFRSTYSIWSPLRFLSAVQSSNLTNALPAKLNGTCTRLYSAARSPTRIRLGLIIQLMRGSSVGGTSSIVQSSHRSGPPDDRVEFSCIRPELLLRRTSAK